MKHSERRELKDQLQSEINTIFTLFIDERRVPDRVLSGSAVAAIDWKENKETALKKASSKTRTLSLNKLRELKKEVESLKTLVM